MSFRTLLAVVGVAGVFLSVQPSAGAAEVKVIAGTAISTALAELGPAFERASGHKLSIEYGLAPALLRRIDGGEAFDLAILSTAPIDALAAKGKIAADTRVEIARDGVAMAVRAGAPKPDIGSAEAFRRTLLSARAIAYTPDSNTGIHLAKVFQRLGIVEQMQAKNKPRQGDAIPQAIAGGEAELGLALTTVLISAPGVDLVGWVPSEFQNYLVFTGAVGAAARQPDAAKALLRYLTASEAVPVLKAKGWDPTR